MKHQVLFFSLLFCLLFFSAETSGQENTVFSTESFSVNSSRSYKIELSPEIINRLNENLGNILLLDEHGKQVNYLLKSEIHQSAVAGYEEFAVVTKERREGCCSEIVVKNMYNRPIDNIVLKLADSVAEKRVTIRGSDDRQQWFVLCTNYPFRAMRDNDFNFEGRIFNIPMTNYKFYKFLVDDFSSPPVAITSAGYHVSTFVKEHYQPLEVSSFIQTDDSVHRETHIDIKFPDYQYIDWLNFYFDAPAQYSYRAKLYAIHERVSKVSHGVDFELNSGYAAQLPLNKFKGNHFRVVIHNDDKTPLKFRSVAAYQLKLYLVAELTRQVHYHLEFGTDMPGITPYTLTHFTSSTSDTLSTVYPGEVKARVQELPVRKEEPKHWWWVGGGVAGVAVMFLLSRWLISLLRKTSAKSS